MEITDLAGLSQPLTKLIEVVSSGIGAISQPILTMANASANAYAIKKIAPVTRENHELLNIECNDNHLSVSTDENQILNRANSRITHQEVTRQENIEHIVQNTVQELKHEETVSNEPVNKDWITRFFNITQDVSDEDMQLIWGKLLAGEVKKPKSYSLRTLELLKNISSDEAATFMKVAKLAITSPDSSFILDDDNYLENNYTIIFADLLQLAELGLIQRNLSIFLSQESNDLTVMFTQGKFYITIKKIANSNNINIPIIKFTTIGNQLLSLIHVAGDKEYVQKFSTQLIRDYTTVEYGLYDPKTTDIVQVLYSSNDQSQPEKV